MALWRAHANTETAREVSDGARRVSVSAYSIDTRRGVTDERDLHDDVQL